MLPGTDIVSLMGDRVGSVVSEIINLVLPVFSNFKDNKLCFERL